MDVSTPRSDIPAARGRIIKRSSNVGAGRPVSAVVVQPVQSVKAPQRRPSKPVGAYPPKRPVGLAVALSFVFTASALLMWNRPINEAAVAVQEEKVSLLTRYHELGNEIAERFTAGRGGRVISVPKKEAESKLPQPKLVSAPKERSSAPHTALETQVYKILKRHGKPTQNGKTLAAAIVKESMLQEYDPVFVAAVIKSESAFNALARSHKGAQGLMQIMPRTGAWLADQQAIPRGKLTDPGHNLKLGISYLKQLEREYGGNRVLTLIAYNWGPGHVEKASSGSRRVPGEVMQYAVKILNDYRRWTSELKSSVG